MPKDATKNIDRYKIRGGQLNEFDFHQNQEQLAEQPSTRGTNLIPGIPPEERVKALRPVVKKAPAKNKKASAKKRTVKATKAKATKSKKATKKKNTAPSRGTTAKKLAGRKAAKKK